MSVGNSAKEATKARVIDMRIKLQVSYWEKFKLDTCYFTTTAHWLNFIVNMRTDTQI